MTFRGDPLETRESESIWHSPYIPEGQQNPSRASYTSHDSETRESSMKATPFVVTEKDEEGVEEVEGWSGECGIERGMWIARTLPILWRSRSVMRNCILETLHKIRRKRTWG
jgi:hypothetical protein